MARRNREDIGEETADLDLAPFMNMVIVLIPLLLLSVVFLEVAVIQVQMPLGGSATTDEPEEEKEPLDLAVTLSTDGFYVSAAGGQQQPIAGCPTQGPTICLTDDGVDAEELYDDARDAVMGGNQELGDDFLNQALEAYDWLALYNMLVEFKDSYPDEETMRISADSDIPFALTVRVMDVARFKLEEDSYEELEEFWQASFDTEMGFDEDAGKEVERPVTLFGSPAFAVHQ